MSTQSTDDQNSQTNETEQKKSSKYGKLLGFKDITLKDILTLLFTLLIPAMIGILAVVLQKNEIDLTEKNRLNDLHISQLQRKSDEEQTEVLGNETVFNNYIRNVMDLAMNYQSDRGQDFQYELTRVLTITALRQVNSEKKRFVVHFLYDIGFARRGPSIFAQSEAGKDLKHLKGVILNNVDFGNGLELWSLSLRHVSLINASFSTSDLEHADFINCVLTGANFSRTNLIGARFFDTQLQRTDFQEASLDNAQFIRSNLTQSNITDEQLSRALAVFNTILPNGTYARNKTYVINGDAQQGLHGWNITSGDIRVVDNSFIGYNSSMMQRINTTGINSFGSGDSFEYYLSFFVRGQENLIIEISFIDKNQKKTTQKISPIQTNSCETSSSNLLNFCYWSYKEYSASWANSMDLKFIFGSANNTTDIVAIKDIQLTFIAE